MRSTDNDEPVSGHRLPLLYNLVYCSRAAAGIGDADVNRIVESARRWNPVFGITGLLVFGSGVFFQWLEGPRENVLHLMSLLKADPRHESVVPLSESEEVRERLFPDWDMERVEPDSIRDVLEDALDNAEDPKNAEVLRLLLDHLDSGELRQLSAA
jgi:hypothetical protein